MAAQPPVLNLIARFQLSTWRQVASFGARQRNSEQRASTGVPFFASNATVYTPASRAPFSIPTSAAAFMAL